MSPPPRRPGSSTDWLRYARADLALARVRLPQDGLYELLCFHAQQAAEKSLKAILVHNGIEPPRTHMLAQLVDVLPTDVPRTMILSQSVRLTVYATASRYPSDEEAVRLAEAIVDWAARIIDTESPAS